MNPRLLRIGLLLALVIPIVMFGIPWAGHTVMASPPSTGGPWYVLGGLVAGLATAWLIGFLGFDVTSPHTAGQESDRPRPADGPSTVEATQRHQLACLTGLPAPLALWSGTLQPQGRPRVDSVSDGYTSLTGLNEPPDDWFGTAVEEDASNIECALETLRAQGRCEVDYRIQLPDGTLRWIHERLAICDKTTDGPWTIAGLALDVTGARLGPQRLLENARMATMGQIALGLTHEFNQPLQVIQLAADNAQEFLRKPGGGQPPSYAVARLERIMEQTERAAELIRLLRLFGPQATALQAIQLRDAVDHVLTLMGQQLEMRDIRVQCQFAELPAVHAARGDLEHIVANLLFNARDALETKPGSRMRNGQDTIWITTSREIYNGAPWAVLAIQDTGCGLPEGPSARLFEPFYTTKEQGLGLGLTLVQGIAQARGGHVELASTSGGARVSVYLPLPPNAQP
ncbi:ATP-binding protein [Thioalkalivibrio sp. ALMg9]|uniref:ATP-binding protein n=1 Tax=Thioalkalivibrio sp. ALMg9 TaxID=1266912 RepID=UPI00036D0AFA|nr:ATP-binding protein [Thioalkalivibrio sp. ALMg9]